MAQKRISRQQQYALTEAELRHTPGAHGAESATQRRAMRYGKNVLAPLEEERGTPRHKTRDISVHHVTGQSRNLLIENIILLAFLAGSIYVLYQLTIYLLNQA